MHRPWNLPTNSLLFGERRVGISRNRTRQSAVVLRYPRSGERSYGQVSFCRLPLSTILVQSVGYRASVPRLGTSTSRHWLGAEWHEDQDRKDAFPSRRGSPRSGRKAVARGVSPWKMQAPTKQSPVRGDRNRMIAGAHIHGRSGTKLHLAFPVAPSGGFGDRGFSISRGSRPMPLTLHPDMVSRKALAAGSWRKTRPVFTGG